MAMQWSNVLWTAHMVRGGLDRWLSICFILAEEIAIFLNYDDQIASSTLSVYEFHIWLLHCCFVFMWYKFPSAVPLVNYFLINCLKERYFSTPLKSMKNLYVSHIGIQRNNNLLLPTISFFSKSPSFIAKRFRVAWNFLCWIN